MHQQHELLASTLASSHCVEPTPRQQRLLYLIMWCRMALQSEQSSDIILGHTDDFGKPVPDAICFYVLMLKARTRISILYPMPVCLGQELPRAAAVSLWLLVRG